MEDISSAVAYVVVASSRQLRQVDTVTRRGEMPQPRLLACVTPFNSTFPINAAKVVQQAPWGL